MTPNGARFTWTGQRLQAAQLVAEDRQTDEAIAAAIGVVKRTIERWKEEPVFMDHVAELRRQMQERLLAEGIADRDNRVLALNERWQKMQQVLEARAVEHAHVPGGRTGLLVRQVKLVKLFVEEGEAAEEMEAQPHGGALKRRRSLQPTGQQIEVDEYAVDTGLLRELRAHEEQAARELGQWEDKRTVKLEVERELERALDALGRALKPEEYARVLEALTAGDASRPKA